MNEINEYDRKMWTKKSHLESGELPKIKKILV